MQYDSLSAFLRRGRDTLAKGPVALIFMEDEAEASATLRHHINLGFRHVVAFGAADLEMGVEESDPVSRVAWDVARDMGATDVVNQVIAASQDIWLYYCFNAEFLFFPFCETRRVGEMIAFNIEERRDTVLTYVVDLYAGNVRKNPNAVDPVNAYMDRSGYYSLARKDRWGNDLDRQMDFFGGLRWRMEEHIPKKRRRIDRVALFKAKSGLKLSEDHTFSDPEYNTYACPWHHNITAAVCSFRTAKALKRNPGSTTSIETFRWHNSVKFKWHSQQLMDLGLMEPGQWF